ncbi:Hint domain-containing protein [Acidocella sp.]|uniref:Hint domain-containing protein n=1 Tax=Acidocella sp. TaxID=50710 RepID=UPI00344EA8E5
MRGTRIATPAGEIPIENLHIGDIVITRFGGYRRIKWIGRQSFARRFIQGNYDQMPVVL